MANRDKAPINVRVAIRSSDSSEEVDFHHLVTGEMKAWREVKDEITMREVVERALYEEQPSLTTCLQIRVEMISSNEMYVTNFARQQEVESREAIFTLMVYRDLDALLLFEREKQDVVQ